MLTYTDRMESKGYDISTEDDDYVEKLTEVARSFRNFGDALTAFLVERGYKGSLNDDIEKLNYVTMHFKRAKMKTPRNMKRWFAEDITIKRETAFQVCFAFGLSVEETDAFFRKVCLSRGIDCHVISEAVYYFCMRTGRNYSEAQELIKQLPTPKKEKLRYGEEIRYTASIVEEINRIDSPTHLLEYLENNLDCFGYNKVTASTYIVSLWKEIAKDDGLAYMERTKLASYEEANVSKAPDKIRNSTWNIYLQLLGLMNEDIKEIASDRTIKPVIRDNILLHPFAADCFPNRESIDKVLEGKCEDISYESVRKVLILLLFYRYWMKLALRREAPSLEARPDDAGRCIAEINHYLSDAGYPMLYYGNPYDWIFLYVAKGDYPLFEFRDFMRELFFVKENEVFTHKEL